MSKARKFADASRISDALTLPAGDTATRPATAVAGSQRFNTDTGSIEFYNGSTWVSTNLIPIVNSVTGTIFSGSSSTLSISVTNATDVVTVRFTESGSVVADVANITVASGSASVAVPAAVYGQTAGDTIAVSVINQDGTPSSNAISKTVAALPSGGTITTSGSYRIHTFTSSSTFVVPSGVTLSNVEYLVIAAGGGGGLAPANPTYQYQGGGGAGGYRCSVVGESSGGGSSAESRLSLASNSYTVTIGAGGSVRSQGGNSVFGSITSIGGGGGASGDSASYVGLPTTGGSGGGGANTAPWNGTYTNGAGAAGTAGQGYAGGSGITSGSAAGNGGGGAGSIGANSPSGNNSKAGGSGVSSSITGSAVTRALGGLGVNDGNLGPVAAGGANTGTGGSSLASGGSGIVIVRYTL